MDPIYPFATPHPSGCGCYLVPPSGVPYKIFRSDVKFGLGRVPGLILQGVASPGTRYLDWDLPVGKSVTYRLEAGGETEEITVEAEPQNTYSAVNDADMEDAENPRDALVVYYATRLAQLTAKGKVVVNLKDGEVESNHARKFSVRTEHNFEEAELPILVLEYEGGEAHGLDLGHEMTEAPFKVEGYFIASSREERDSARQAFVGLWRDTEWFLEDVGCYEADMINIKNSMQPDEPPFYILSFDIVGVFAVDQNAREQTWSMLSRVEWSAPDGE